MKKLVSIVLALAMILVVAVASANTITIESNAPANSTNNTTYTWYWLLRAQRGTGVDFGEPDEDTGVVATDDLASPVTYYLNSPDEDTLAGLLNATNYLVATKSADGTRWNITTENSPTGLQLAEALNTAAITAAALNHGTETASGNSDVEIDVGNNDGYYLIVASNGTKLIAQSLGDVTIKEKNTYITDVKTVDEADLAVGEKAHFTITVHVPNTAVVSTTDAPSYITVHDTMDSELTFDNNLIATFNGSEITLTDGEKKANTELFAKKFEITSEMLGNDVILTYTATVNETADPDEDGFVNTSFANDSNFETLPTTVRVYTFDFNLDKTFVGVAAADVDNYSATFNLKKGGTVLKFNVATNGEYVLALDQSASSTASADLVVTGGDAINIRGLDAGDYELVETDTAAGFNKLTESIDVRIIDDTANDDKNNPDVEPTYHVVYKMHSASTYTGESPNKTVAVDNNAGTQLPSTGGIGTTIFYILGGLLVVGAAVILVARRRVHE